MNADSRPVVCAPAFAMAGLGRLRGRGHRRVRRVRAGADNLQVPGTPTAASPIRAPPARAKARRSGRQQAQARGRSTRDLAANAGPAVPSSLTAPVSIPGPRAALPKHCDNAASLQPVIARLDSAATPDDVRGFLAEERLRLVRCEYTRLTAGEWREREQRMRDVDARDAARRQAAVARIDALYDQYLTPAEQAVRVRNRGR